MCRSTPATKSFVHQNNKEKDNQQSINEVTKSRENKTKRNNERKTNSFDKENKIILSAKWFALHQQRHPKTHCRLTACYNRQ